MADIENPFDGVAIFRNVSDEVVNEGVELNEAEGGNENPDTCHPHVISFDQLLSGVLKLTIAENMILVFSEIIGETEDLLFSHDNYNQN